MKTAMIYVLIINVIGICLKALYKHRDWHFVVGIPLILAALLALTFYFTR